MSEIITINPLTRISGYLEIRAEIHQNRIVNAESEGLLYRGFETMLQGRRPMDSVFFTERICGICSAAHATASSMALENAFNITITKNDKYIRDIIHGFEFIQNHLRQFFLFTFPSYVKMTGLEIASRQQYRDFRLPEEKNKQLEQHYIDSIRYARLAHEGQAVLGGKAPHNHGIFVGGVTVIIDAYKLAKLKAIIRQITDFVNSAMIEDADILARYYPDYFESGISYPNFLSYGVFDNGDPEISYLGPGVMIDGVRSQLQADQILEQVRYAWYKTNQTDNQEIDMTKSEAYSFVKAPRYHGQPMEVGPLARLIITGEYTRGHSCMDRNIARVMETSKICSIISNLVDRVELLPDGQRTIEVPGSTQGMGLVDTTRGALAHFIYINNQVIQNYNIITPSVWNLSPRDDAGNPGVTERALIGSPVADVNEPVEIGRIVRSFDPCVSCATHLIKPDGNKSMIEVLV